MMLTGLEIHYLKKLKIDKDVTNAAQPGVSFVAKQARFNTPQGTEAGMPPNLLSRCAAFTARQDCESGSGVLQTHVAA